MGRPRETEVPFRGTETHSVHGLRRGHRGCPALSIPPTAWRAPIRGAPVTAEGWGPITSERSDPTGVRHHIPMADRTHHTRDANTGPAMDGETDHGATPSRHGRTRERERTIGPLSIGGDERTAVCYFHIWRGLRRKRHLMRLLWSRSQTERKDGNREDTRTRLQRTHHPRGACFHALHLLPIGHGAL